MTSELLENGVEDKYEGEFFNDAKHGKGALYLKNGKIIEAEWNKGKRIFESILED
jgi:hypothetical protein